MVETHTLYYRCSKCGKENSQLTVPGYPPTPYLDCPLCGGPIIFDPSCFVCSNQGTLDCMLDCRDFKMFKQMERKPKRNQQGVISLN